MGGGERKKKRRTQMSAKVSHQEEFQGVPPQRCVDWFMLSNLELKFKAHSISPQLRCMGERNRYFFERNMYIVEGIT